MPSWPYIRDTSANVTDVATFGFRQEICCWKPWPYLDTDVLKLYDLIIWWNLSIIRFPHYDELRFYLCQYSD